VVFIIVEAREVRPATEYQLELIGWAFRKLDPETLDSKVRVESCRPATFGSVEEFANRLSELLISVYDANIPRRYVGGSKRKPVHWWNNEIANLMLACLKSRRTYLRMVKRGDQRAASWRARPSGSLAML